MPILAHTLDHAIQELAMVRARHEELASRHQSPVVRQFRTRPHRHAAATIAIVSPEL